MALAEELDTANVLTLDLRGFPTYRWKTRCAFKIDPHLSTRIPSAARTLAERPQRLQLSARGGT